MKNIVKMLGLCVLIGFSFFYTDKVIEVIREEDKIMIELTSVLDIYKKEATNATIVGNTIIPGLNGKEINIDASYKKMKTSGIFNKNLLIYDKVSPSINLQNNKDKFIIKGNQNKQMVSVVFILDNDLYFEKINKILEEKETEANYFVTYSYLINNSAQIKELPYGEFYSYGDDGEYTPDNLLFSNNLLSRLRNKDAIYCLNTNMDEKVLNLCNQNKLYTIVPTIIADKNPYTNLKNNLNNGSIILLSMNSEIINELSTIIDYIKGKGIKIVGLSTLLSEDIN